MPNSDLVKSLNAIKAGVSTQMDKFGRLDLDTDDAGKVLDQFQVLSDAITEITKDYEV